MSGSKRQNCNKFVSTLRPPSLDCLQWTPQTDKKVRNSKVWEFMSILTVSDASSGRSGPIDDQLYCKLCLEEQKGDAKGHMSKIYCSKKSTATGNHLIHAAAKHNQEQYHNDQPQRQQPKLTAWMKKLVDNQPASTQYEFNRDLAIMVCRDLMPFIVVEKPGFTTFCKKNTSFELPSVDTVGTTALIDVYSVAKQKVLELLSTCFCGTLMVDGWTDKYKGKLYFAIRMSLVHNWKFKVVTLSIQSVESHTSQSLCKVVKNVIEEFLPHHKRVMFFNTTDGASNMKLLSKLLRHERIECTAHCMHLLITFDGLSKVPELQNLLQKCKDIVSILHFKGHLVASIKDTQNDIAMFERIQRAMEILQCDDANPVIDDDEDDEAEANDVASVSDRDKTTERKGHVSLKNSFVTRWNSSLTMIELVLDLRVAMNEALRKIGKFDMCLDDDDFSVLEELKVFLSSFKSMTLLVSACSPNLSLLPLLRTRIIKACETQRDEHERPADSASVKRLKALVKASVDKRIKINDLVKLASCFDPGVRNVILTNDECRQLLQEAYHHLTSDGLDGDTFTYRSPVRHIFIQNTVTANDGLQPAGDRPTSAPGADESDDVSAKRLRLSLLQETANTSAVGGSRLADPFGVELSRYVGLSVNQDSTAFDFWEKHEADFPILANMAKIYLGVSPGSVPVECLFSTTGLLLNA